MAHRQFTDAGGLEWTVYDVIPRTDERRSHERRESTVPAEHPVEDRRGDERRATIQSPRPIRVTRGWLCFESERERRRLQPIPENWHLMSEVQLSELLQEARVAPRRTKPEEQGGEPALS